MDIKHRGSRRPWDRIRRMSPGLPRRSRGRLRLQSRPSVDGLEDRCLLSLPGEQTPAALIATLAPAAPKSSALAPKVDPALIALTASNPAAPVGSDVQALGSDPASVWDPTN